jgi:hypothetical protein
VSTLNGGGVVTEDSSLGSGDITVSAAINWTGTGVLNLFAYRNLNINNAITGDAGSLNIKAVTINAPATVSVKNFDLQAGTWIQNAAVLPDFDAYNFTISGGSFLRVNGGSGLASDPYQIRDIYGLQGIGSNAAYTAANWRVITTIDASRVANWNGGEGFAPISNFTGVFDGNGNVGAISGLYINRPGENNAGLFGSIDAGGSVSNVVLNAVNISGLSNVGAVAGSNAGQLNTSSATGVVKGQNTADSFDIDGLVGNNSGNITNSFAAVSVTGYGKTGGLAGSNNAGSIVLSYATGKVNAANSFQVGGLVGANDSSASVIAGRLIDGSGTSVSSVSGAVHVGGLVGNNADSVTQSSVLGNGSVQVRDIFSTVANSIGGLVGYNRGNIISNFSSITVGQALGTTDAQYVGGFAEFNSNSVSISGIYSTGNVTGYRDVGGLVGSNQGSIGEQSFATGAVTGGTSVGGLIGYNNISGTISKVYAQGSVNGVSNVGGLIGNKVAGNIVLSSATGNVIGSSMNVGGLIGNNAGNISASFTSGNVIASGVVKSSGSATNIGGLVGSNESNSTITVSFISGTV